MGKSLRQKLLEEFRSLSKPEQRYRDIALQFRVWVRGDDGLAKPGPLAGPVFGGRWDNWSRCYTGPADPANVREISLSQAQADAILSIRKGVRHVLVLGSPGGGKTDLVVAWQLKNLVEFPGKPELFTAPTNKRLKILWTKLLSKIEAFDWIENKISDIRLSDQTIRIANGSTALFISTKRHSEALGSPVAGVDAAYAANDETQNMTDEDLQEIEARGRINKDFISFETATMERIPEFRKRVRRYEQSPHCQVVRVRGDENVFTPLEHWEALKAQLPPDVYRRRILGEDLPDDDAVYPQFGGENVRNPSPQESDCTSEVVRSAYPDVEGIKYIVGTDLGATVNASIFLKAYRTLRGDRIWYAFGEVITKNRTSDFHADAVMQWAAENGAKSSQLLILNDPHGAQTEESDLQLLRRAGLKVIKASHRLIPRKHRYTMVNTLCCDTKGVRRLFLCHKNGDVIAAKAEESLLGLKFYPSSLRVDAMHKDPRRDLTHYTDDLGYGLWPFESLRGQATVVSYDEDRKNKWELNQFLA